jgi:hypothetical protein
MQRPGQSEAWSAAALSISASSKPPVIRTIQAMAEPRLKRDLEAAPMPGPTRRATSAECFEVGAAAWCTLTFGSTLSICGRAASQQQVTQTTRRAWHLGALSAHAQRLVLGHSARTADCRCALAVLASKARHQRWPSRPGNACDTPTQAGLRRLRTRRQHQHPSRLRVPPARSLGSRSTRLDHEVHTAESRANTWKAQRRNPSYFLDLPPVQRLFLKRSGGEGGGYPRLEVVSVS